MKKNNKQDYRKQKSSQIFHKDTSFSKKILYHALVLDAETRQSLVTIRSLGSKGLRIAALGNFGKNAPAFSSKWCQIGITAPAEEGTQKYINFLIDFLKKNQVQVLIPSSDGTIAILRKYRKELTKLTSIALASENALQIAINKNATLAVAKKLGIKIPLSIKVASKKQISKALKLIRFPIVIKPAESWTEGNKGRKRVCPELATTPQEAYEIFAKVTEYGGETIFQEYLSGKREAVSFLYANKKIFAKFAQWAKRTQPPLGGTSVLRQSIKIPNDIGILAEKLIKAINLEGYSEVEFRRDNNENPYFMEINPRLSASVEIAVHSQVNFPFLLYQWASREKISKVTTYQEGLWERYLAGDIITTIQAFQQKGRPGVMSQPKVLFDFFSSFFHPMSYDYINWQDMLPAWKASTDLFLRNIKKVSLFTYEK